MPIKSCKLPEGGDGYQWGDSGKCYADRAEAEKQAAAAHANGYAGDSAIAFDRSVRHFDVDGRLHVDKTNISKATVNPYYGKEIPYDGLQPDRVYQMLRHPDELAKAADTFRNLPLLIEHVPVSAADHRPDLVVGTTGSDVSFDGKYLTCSLSIWDDTAIAGVESREQTELSSAYRYVADMTPGTFEGMPYDGIMRQIVGNHVALVNVGRAGKDVVVADSNPFKEIDMKKNVAISAVLAALVANSIAADSAPYLAIMALDAAKDDEEPKIVAGQDEDDDETEEEKKKRLAAMDEDDDVPSKKPAMDAASVQAMIDTATAATRKDMEALYVARDEVTSIVGKVAMDSAEAVYKFALDTAGIDVTGVHPSAYRALVKMHGERVASAPAVITMDSGKATERFPDISRIKWS